MKILITLLFTISSFIAFAQEKTITTGNKKITGIITDSEGLPVPGVTVIIEGTNEKAITDFDGNYTINTKEGEKLIASYIGMFDEIITFNQQNSINFKLRENPSFTINDKCYAPYLKREITPISSESTGSLHTEFLKMRTDTTRIVKDGCVGGQSKAVVIRCLGSLNETTEPFYVIDNVPSNAEELKAINSDDIISVNVLKDAGATSIYGNRGANGVIIVKTKNGLTKKEKHKQEREAKRLAKKQTEKS